MSDASAMSFFCPRLSLQSARFYAPEALCDEKTYNQFCLIYCRENARESRF